ncbi:MAG: DNA-binding protein [Desulfuromonadaceae bacterium]
MDGGWFKEWNQGRCFIIKIKPGEKLRERLVDFARESGVKSAVIMSAVGSVRNAFFRGIKAGAKRPITVPRMRQHTIEGPLEMLGLEGNIISTDDGDIDCHLHIILGNSSGEVFGGHMFDAEVFASCEIVLTEMVVQGVGRQLSKSTGTPTIYINEE